MSTNDITVTAASLALLKRPCVTNASTLSKTALYESIKRGTFPPPIKLAKRCVAWPKLEVDKWLFAKYAGYTDQQMRELIQSMLAARTSHSLSS
jgi:prophage regulatory protein